MTNLIVVARARARAGAEEEMYSALCAIVEPTLTEDGCIEYTLCRGADDPSIFMTFERWRSKADIDEHMGQPYVRELFARVADLVAEPPEIVTYREA